MSELGQVLQRAREEKNISLDDIQKVTKIQRRYLEAIERGHFHVLPGHFYARAFIKSYAEAVGLDPNELLSHFQSDLPAQPPQEQLERLRRRRAASKEPLQAGRWVTQTLLVLFVVLVIGVIYMAFVNRTGVDTAPVPGDTLTNRPQVGQPDNGSVNIPPPSPGLGQTGNVSGETIPPVATPEEKPVLTFESQQGPLYEYTLDKSAKLSIKVSATTGDCWVKVMDKRNGKAIGEKAGRTLKKGEENTYEAETTAYIVVGNPKSAQVTINDAPVDMSKLTFFPSNISVKIKQAE